MRLVSRIGVNESVAMVISAVAVVIDGVKKSHSDREMCSGGKREQDSRNKDFEPRAGMTGRVKQSGRMGCG
jgi:hypothetical protein